MAKKEKKVETIKEEVVETPEEEKVETKKEENKDWKWLIHCKANCNYWSIKKWMVYDLSKKFYEANKNRFDLI